MLDEMFGGVYNSKNYHMNDRDMVLQRAKGHGIDSIICTATNLEESLRALNFCREYNTNMVSADGSKLQLFSTVGVHPTRCDEICSDDTIISKLDEIIADGISDGTVVAVGECGLDYDRLFFCSKENQLRGFQNQLDLIAKYDLPAFFHNRNTSGDFLRVVTENRAKIPRSAVVHSFTGSMEEMRSLVELGFYIGINGCSLKTEENLVVAAAVPEELLLLETDAPWCGIKSTHASSKLVKTKFNSVKKEKYSPGCMVKDRNEPCAIVQVLEVLAAVREREPVALAAQIRSNTQRLFFRGSER